MNKIKAGDARNSTAIANFPKASAPRFWFQLHSTSYFHVVVLTPLTCFLQATQRLFIMAAKLIVHVFIRGSLVMRARMKDIFEDRENKNPTILFGIHGIVMSGLLVCCISPAVATNLYKWIDSDGNVTYQDSAPPGSVSYEEQTYAEPIETSRESISLSIEAVAEKNPISFYSMPSCDSCDLVRLFLEQKSIPFAEINIQDNVTMQQELKSKSGQLRVPTLVIGDEVIDGYSKSAIRRSLEENGYPIE